MSETLLAGRYQLGEIIGTGGMSDVYATTDILLGREVAVKVMRANLASDATFKERFRREAQAAAQLNHPAIVQVYDTGETTLGGVLVPYIVMERVHGRTIRDIVRQDGPLDVAKAAGLLVPICDALQHSHSAGIIHRDVKPANIMITTTGSIKIMDFGIARAIGGAETAMTQTAAVIGTAQYLSPEQARGKSADARSDVYALGCVLYEMITGRPPFEGETPYAVAYQHVQEDPPPPSSRIAHLTPTEAINVDAVVLTAMAKNPADRYHTAQQFSDDLKLLSRNAVTQAAKAHLHQPAPRPQPTEQPTRQYQRQRPAVQPQPAAPPAPQPVVQPVAHQAPARDKSRPWLIVVASILGVIVVAMGAGIGWKLLVTEDSDTVASSQSVSVPKLAGTQARQAQQTLEKLGVKVDTTLESSPTVDEGLVIATNPGAGSTIKKGSTVELTVSSGTETTEVPDLSHRSTNAAAALLEAAGLKLDPAVGETTSDTIPKGQVVEQKPRPGAKVAKNSTVKIVVSTGEDVVRIPVVTGQMWEQAEGNLTAAGFDPVVKEVDSDRPEGTVISCENEGTDQPRGSTVTVEISNGNMVKMPDLNGMNPGQAINALRAAGWTADATSLLQNKVATGSLVESGLITAQDPPAGQLVNKDGLVTISVAAFDPRALLNP